MNRPIPTQPIANKKQEERHPALLPVLAIIAALCAVAAFIFVEDNYLKPKREADEAKRFASNEDPMFVPVDQYMDTMSVRNLDLTDPAVIELIKTEFDKPFDREPLNLGPPRQQRAVRELAVRREVPPYEEQITVWFVPERTPVEVLPRYYRAILTRGFQLPVSYNPGQNPQPGVPFPGGPSNGPSTGPSTNPINGPAAGSMPLENQPDQSVAVASDQHKSSDIPSPPPAAANENNDIAGPSAGVNVADIPLPEPERVTTSYSEFDSNEHPATQPVLGYNLMFSRKIHENSPSGSINPYRVQSEVLIFRLVPVNGGTRMVSWLRTPIKDRASKKSDESKNQAEPQTKPSSGSGKTQR